VAAKLKIAMHAYVKSMLTFFNYFSTINNICIYNEQ